MEILIIACVILKKMFARNAFINSASVFVVANARCAIERGGLLNSQVKLISRDKMKIEKCDKCGSWIDGNGECFCGKWIDSYRDLPFTLMLEKALLMYDQLCEQNNDDSPMSGDHWSGNCFVFFKGDYNLCEEIKKYIKSKENKNED